MLQQYSNQRDSSGSLNDSSFRPMLLGACIRDFRSSGRHVWHTNIKLACSSKYGHVSTISCASGSSEVVGVGWLRVAKRYSASAYTQLSITQGAPSFLFLS